MQTEPETQVLEPFQPMPPPLKMCQQSYLLVAVHGKELTLSPKLGLCKDGNCEQQDGCQTDAHVERSVFLQDADES